MQGSAQIAAVTDKNPSKIGELDLTDEQIARITDYTNLRVKVVASTGILVPMLSYCASCASCEGSPRPQCRAAERRRVCLSERGAGHDRLE